MTVADSKKHLNTNHVGMFCVRDGENFINGSDVEVILVRWVKHQFELVAFFDVEGEGGFVYGSGVW